MRSAVVPVCLLTAALAGCAGNFEERQLDEMRATIDEVQRERDQAERDMMASSIADTHAASGVPARQPAPALAPPESFALGDGAGGGLDAPDTEDPSPRPTIRIFGSPRVGRNAWREDQVEQSGGGDDGPGVPRSSALDPEAKPAYEAALALVNSHQYDRALDALAAFLVKYPDHPYADNAMYWRGECYFAKGDYLRASEQFEGTVTRFPAGNKAPDALLKLGHEPPEARQPGQGQGDLRPPGPDLPAERGRPTHPARVHAGDDPARPQHPRTIDEAHRPSPRDGRRRHRHRCVRPGRRPRPGGTVGDASRRRAARGRAGRADAGQHLRTPPCRAASPARPVRRPGATRRRPTGPSAAATPPSRAPTPSPATRRTPSTSARTARAAAARSTATRTARCSWAARASAARLRTRTSCGAATRSGASAATTSRTRTSGRASGRTTRRSRTRTGSTPATRCG